MSINYFWKHNGYQMYLVTILKPCLITGQMVTIYVLLFPRTKKKTTFGNFIALENIFGIESRSIKELLIYIQEQLKN